LSSLLSTVVAGCTDIGDLCGDLSGDLWTVNVVDSVDLMSPAARCAVSVTGRSGLAGVSYTLQQTDSFTPSVSVSVSVSDSDLRLTCG